MKLHALHCIPPNGTPSSGMCAAGCSGSSTALGVMTEYCAKYSSTCRRCAMRVPCCSCKCLSRLTMPVRCCLHTSTPNSSRKQNTVSQFCRVMFWGHCWLPACCALLLFCCLSCAVPVAARLSQTGFSIADVSVRSAVVLTTVHKF